MDKGKNNLAGFTKKAAGTVSAVFNPAVSLVVYLVYFSVKNFSFGQALRYFLPIFLIILMPAILWIFFMVKAGRYSNADVSDRRQRRSLYFLLEVLMAVYLVWDFTFRDDFNLVVLFILVLTVALQLSNYFIKSSMHTAFNIFTSALFFSQDFRWGIVWAFITCCVAVSRVVLKRHTVAEVLSGFFIASVVSIVYLYINIQIGGQK